MPKVLIADVIPPALVERLRAAAPAGVQVDAVTTPQDDEFARRAAGAEILLVIHRKIDARTLAVAPSVRFVQRAGVGFDNLDVQALKAAGVLAAYTPGANAAAVAEHTVLLMLALLKRLVPAEAATRAGHWPANELVMAGIGDLAGATVGLVGLGAIGRAVADRLVPFGARLLYTTRHRAPAEVEARLGATHAELPDLLRQATIVSLHLPLGDESRGLIGERELALMQPGALLVNTARGELVDETALARAIERGHLGGAALDVLQHEGEGGNPFRHLDRVIVTPHVAGASRAAVARIMQMAMANLARFLAGQEPQDLVPGTR